MKSSVIVIGFDFFSGEPLKLEIENFLASTEKKQELVVKPEQSVNVTKIAEAALLSSQKGTPIYLDLK